ncbi:MAG: acylphosphatase [Euryarchaeota archaeon]|nr:acylphosphatase [Euryarchaeota archaeon]
MNSEKQYAIDIKGKIQMTGFRSFIEANALSLGLGGIVFNDKDGSVKILCEGNEDKVKTLIHLIEIGSVDIGARIESIKEEEIPIKIPLPPTFFKEPTVELKDIKERLDEGIKILRSMDNKLGKLDKLDKLDGIQTTLVDIKSILNKIVEK